MIAIIRIKGQVKIDEIITQTLNRLRVMKKYTCVVVNETPETLGMIKRAKDYIAYGKIDEKTLVELIKTRAKVIGDTKAKVKDAEKIAKEILAGKSFEDLKIKPFFGLHPPRGGIDTKHHYPKGAIGNHGENITKLIMKML